MVGGWLEDGWRVVGGWFESGLRVVKEVGSRVVGELFNFNSIIFNLQINL